MKTSAKIMAGDATRLAQVGAASVDLVLTSPPYPMIEMWDGIFQEQRPGVQDALAAHDGERAFELMHEMLDAAWAEIHRVLRPGGIACINIGDATRTIDRDFRLYSNHSRILWSLLRLGFVALPDILWRKPTNAPNKFMGSGMLPVGAYVTYEHEYILVVRKGLRRDFRSPEDKERRRQSAFFWEERNLWFSDVWFDIRGAGQGLIDESSRKRSAAFPFELAYRLISMFSVKGDTVLDPFAGTGIAAAAAIASGRNAISIELDATLLPVTHSLLYSLPQFSNSQVRKRLARHVDFIKQRSEQGTTVKYLNQNYRFPVVTSQEQELLLNDMISVTGDSGSLTALYSDDPQPEFVRDWSTEEIDQSLSEATDLQVHLQL